MEKKILVTTAVTVEIELLDKVITILEDAGWEYTGSHQAYKIDGVLKQTIHFKTYMSANNIC